MSHKSRCPSTSKKQSQLDNLMMTYADISGGNKGSGGASSFKGPALKDVKIEKSLGPTYKTSQKSRDWSTLSQNLEDAFVASSPATKSLPHRNTNPVVSNVAFRPQAALCTSQIANQQVSNAQDDEWGDFQDFSGKNVFTQKTPTAIVNFQHNVVPSPVLTSSIPSSNLFLSNELSPKVTMPPLSASDDDDFADFVTAAPSASNSKIAPLPSFNVQTLTPFSQDISTYQPTPPSSHASNINQPNESLSMNTVGSRLAAFQEESPIHRFKTNNPFGIDLLGSSKPPQNVNKINVELEEKDDDFSEFASARHVHPSATICSSQSNIRPSIPNAVSLPFTSNFTTGTSKENNFAVPLSDTPILHPTSIMEDKYRALRGGFAGDLTVKESDSKHVLKETGPFDEIKQQAMGNPTGTLFCEPIQTPATVTSKESFVDQNVFKTKSHSVLHADKDISSPLDEEDDFGDFITVKEENTSVLTSSNNLSTLHSSIPKKPKDHVRSDTFFMPQSNTPSTILPVWHDSEPPPLMDENQDTSGMDGEQTIGTGALTDEFFAGFGDNNVASSGVPVDGFGCSSILDEDQYFEAPANETTSTETKEREHMSPSLDASQIQRKNSISSLNLRVGSTSPEDVRCDKTIENNLASTNNIDRYDALHDVFKTSEIKDNNCAFNSSCTFKSPTKEWLASLDEIQIIISQATDAFTYIPSDAVLEEVLESDEGSNYVKNIVEIYRVFKRIQLAHEKYLQSRDKDCIDSTSNEGENLITERAEKIEQAWKQLTINLNGKSIIPEKAAFNFTEYLVNECEYKSENRTSNNRTTVQEISDICGLCLLNVPSSKYPNDNNQSNAVIDSVLEHASRKYHSTCANFWVNRVNVDLPTLALSLINEL